jgi:hypothetical protein
MIVSGKVGWGEEWSGVAWQGIGESCCGVVLHGWCGARLGMALYDNEFEN